MSAGETAFVHRTPRFLLKHAAQVGFRAGDDRRSAARDWAARSWELVWPWGTGGVSPNYPDADLPDWGRAYYGANLPRLRRTKTAYDPDGVFRFPQSLPGG